MKDQLHKIMKAEGMTPAKFADEIGVQRSSISHIISGRNKPSYDFITKILDRFKGINAEWLLTGEGSMIKGQETSSITNKHKDSLFDMNDTPINLTSSQTNIDLNAINPIKKEVHSTHSVPGKSSQSFGKSQTIRKEFTNVNNIKYILVFYEDGSFEQHNPRE